MKKNILSLFHLYKRKKLLVTIFTKTKKYWYHFFHNFKFFGHLFQYMYRNVSYIESVHSVLNLGHPCLHVQISFFFHTFFTYSSNPHILKPLHFPLIFLYFPSQLSWIDHSGSSFPFTLIF